MKIKKATDKFRKLRDSVIDFIFYRNGRQRVSYNSWKYLFEDIFDAVKGNPLPLISVVISAAAFGYALWIAVR